MQQSTMTLDRLSEAQGQPVYSSDGEKIGTTEEIFYDYETRQPEWLGIGTGILGTKRVLVPVAGADLRSDGVYVLYPKDKVKDAPDVDTDEIPEDLERTLYSYYGLGYSERRSETVLPERGTPSVGPEDEAAVSRHEEELKVGKRSVEAGRARLRKWVETEPVSEEVTLERERARVTREPIDRPTTDAEIGEAEVEIPLRAEEPVVQKETVAKERIGLEKDVETTREPVTGEVRKERVEVEGDTERDR